jgi:hypothetical protein
MRRASAQAGEKAAEKAAEKAVAGGGDGDAASAFARRVVQAQLRKATTAPSTRKHLHLTGEHQFQDVALSEVRVCVAWARGLLRGAGVADGSCACCPQPFEVNVGMVMNAYMPRCRYEISIFPFGSNGRPHATPAGARARPARPLRENVDAPEKKQKLSRAEQRRCSAQPPPPHRVLIPVRAVTAHWAHAGTVAMPPCQSAQLGGRATILGTLAIGYYQMGGTKFAS